MLEEADVYGHVTSRYYDAVYAKLRGSRDLEFYRDLAVKAQGPILELGCGTGRVLIPISTLGIPCTGLDVSPRMLSVLRRKPISPTLRLVCAPLQDFDLAADRFMLIYSAFRVFQHLYSEEEQLATFRCVRRHLAPGGLFAFDVFSPDPERSRLAHEPEASDARFEIDGEEVVRYVEVERDPARQILVAHMRYERRDGDQVVENEKVDVKMRYFYRPELESLLERSGFRDVQFLGDFDGRPYDERSPEIIVLAR